MKYDSIMYLARPVSQKHIPMSMRNRAAQFAPFAALTGLDDDMKETARLTDSFIELSEDRAAELDDKTGFLISHASERPEITIEYFLPDARKSGGAYISARGAFRRFDESAHALVLTDGTAISYSCIYNIYGDIFNGK